MTTSSIDIKKINIKNIKNVCDGKIDFSDEEGYVNVLGIYGQNGSGKTALVESLTIIKTLVLGDGLEQNVTDLINENKIAEIDIEIVFDSLYKVNYICELTRQNNKVKILSENLYYKVLKKYQREKMLFKYKDYGNELDIDFGRAEITSVSEDVKVKLLTAQALSEEKSTSFLFSDRITQFLKNDDNKNILNPELLKVVKLMSNEFAHNLFIYSNKLSGMIFAQIFLPISFQVDNVYGLAPIPMDSNESIPENLFKTAQLIFKQINNVLPMIIPGLTVELKVKNQSKNLQGQTEYEVSVDSVRNGKSIGFKNESDGIKKIVSILSTIINVYNSKKVIAIIDEFDAGIFEFLLGEIIELLSDDAKGQLIFTSHNLRPLEVLPNKKIIFTTTNPENRYIHMSNVKRTNNLRDMYIRTVQLGGAEEELYKSSNTSKIRRAFRKAGLKNG